MVHVHFCDQNSFHKHACDCGNAAISLVGIWWLFGLFFYYGGNFSYVTASCRYKGPTKIFLYALLTAGVLLSVSIPVVVGLDDPSIFYFVSMYITYILRIIGWSFLAFITSYEAFPGRPNLSLFSSVGWSVLEFVGSGMSVVSDGESFATLIDILYSGYFFVCVGVLVIYCFKLVRLDGDEFFEAFQVKHTDRGMHQKLLSGTDDAKSSGRVVFPSIWGSMTTRSTPALSNDRATSRPPTGTTRRGFNSVDLTEDTEQGELRYDFDAALPLPIGRNTRNNSNSTANTDVSAEDKHLTASWRSSRYASNASVGDASLSSVGQAAVKATVVDCSFVVVHKEAKMLYKIGLSESADVVKRATSGPVSISNSAPSNNDNRSVRIVLKRVDEVIYLRETIFAQFPQVSLPPLPTPVLPDKAEIEQAVARETGNAGIRIRLSASSYDSHIECMNSFLHALINHPVAGKLVVSELRNSQIDTLASSPNTPVAPSKMGKPVVAVSEHAKKPSPSTALPTQSSPTKVEDFPEFYPFIVGTNAGDALEVNVAGWSEIPITAAGVIIGGSQQSKKNKSTTAIFFEVEVQYNGRKWSVRKRYRQFRALLSALVRMHTHSNAGRGREDFNFPELEDSELFCNEVESMRRVKTAEWEQMLNEQTLGLDYFVKTALQVTPMPGILLGFLETDVFVSPCIDIVRQSGASGEIQWEYLRTNNASQERRQEWSNLILKKIPVIYTAEGSAPTTAPAVECLNSLNIPSSFVGEDDFLMPNERLSQDFVNIDNRAMHASVSHGSSSHNARQLGGLAGDSLYEEEDTQSNMTDAPSSLPSISIPRTSQNTGSYYGNADRPSAVTGGMFSSFTPRGASMMFSFGAGSTSTAPPEQKHSTEDLLLLPETMLVELMSLISFLQVDKWSQKDNESTIFGLRNSAENDFVSTYESMAFDNTLLVDDDSTLTSFLDRKDLFVVGGQESSSHLSSTLLLEVMQGGSAGVPDSATVDEQFPSGVWISQFRARNMLLLSTAFHDITRSVEALRGLSMKDVNKFLSNNEKLSFLLNLYNLMSLHASVLVHWPPAHDAIGRVKWQHTVKYQFSSSELSLLKLEHGIIRSMSQKLDVPTIAASEIPVPNSSDCKHFTPIAPTKPEARVSFVLSLPFCTSPKYTCIPHNAVCSSLQHATTKYISASVGFFDNKVIVPLVCRFYKDDIKNWNDIYGRSDSSLPWDAMNAPVAMPAVTNLVSAEGNSTSLQNAAKGKVGSSRRQLRLTEEDDSNDGTHWDAIRKQKSLTEVAPVVTIPTTVVPLPSAALVTDTHGNASTTSLPAPAMDLKMLESHVSENMLMRMCRRVKNLVDTKDRTYHMKTYKNVFLGREAINALRNSKEVRSRAEAIVYLNVLIEFGLVRHACGDHWMKEVDLFYVFTGIEPTIPQLSPYYVFIKAHLNDRKKVKCLSKSMEDDESLYYQLENHSFAFPLTR